MKKLMIVVAMLMLAGCEQESQTKTATSAAQAVAQAPIKTHNYSLKEGYEYGYERAVSVEQANKGQVASSLMMAKFAGQRNGKYQVYATADESPGAVIVAECSNPCEFMKVMVFFRGEHINTQRMRVAPEIIGWMMLEDAINGKLDQYVAERNGKKMHIWFDEQKGIIATPI